MRTPDGRGGRRRAGAVGHPDVTVAVLASHPALRPAMRRSVPSVRRMISATDLHDHDPRRRGDGYDRWRARWRERHPQDLWTGDADLVPFPWNEPDQAVWNPTTEGSEPGWRVLPGSVCLKNRPPLIGE